MNNKTAIQKIIFWIIIGFIALFSYFLLIKIPHIGEDFALRATDIYHSASLNQILKSILSQMANWNIRIGEQIAIIFSSVDKQIFNFIQAFMIALYFYLYIVFTTGQLRIKDYKQASFILIVSLFLVITFMPTLFEVFFWIAGSANYFYSLIIVLLFLLPYRLLLFGNRTCSSKLLIIYTFVFGFFSGLSNENVCISVFIMLLFTVIYRHFKKISIPNWSIVGLVSIFLGMLVLLLAPSTRIRIDYYNNAYNVQPGITKYFGRTAGVVYNFFYSKEFLLLVLSIVAIVIIYLCYERYILHHPLKKLFKLSDNLTIQGCFLIFASLSIAALVCSPYIEKRSYIFFDTFLFMFFVCLLIRLMSNHKFIVFVVSLGLICVSIFEYGLLKTNIYSFSESFEIVDTEIKAKYYEGAETVTVDYPVVINNRYMNNRMDYFSGMNYAIDRYYSIDVIQR